MNIDDFINEIENTNKRFKTKQEEKFEKLTDRYKGIQHEVLKTAFFRDNMKEIISDVYDFIKGIIYPTLLEFCLEVLKITKDKQK